MYRVYIRAYDLQYNAWFSQLTQGRKGKGYEAQFVAFSTQNAGSCFSAGPDPSFHTNKASSCALSTLKSFVSNSLFTLDDNLNVFKYI